MFRWVQYGVFCFHSFFPRNHGVEQKFSVTNLDHRSESIYWNRNLPWGPGWLMDTKGVESLTSRRVSLQKQPKIKGWNWWNCCVHFSSNYYFERCPLIPGGSLWIHAFWAEASPLTKSRKRGKTIRIISVHPSHLMSSYLIFLSMSVPPRKSRDLRPIPSALLAAVWMRNGWANRAA